MHCAEHAHCRAETSRALTPGECAIARTVFGGAVEAGRVRVFRRCYLPFGLQPRGTAMAPDGAIYFHPTRFRADFADPARPGAQRWFVHEMTHVWQHQLGFPVKWRGAVRLGLSYDYVLHDGARLGDFDMEAQGEILADAFVLGVLGRPEFVAQAEHRRDPLHAVRLDALMRDFLRDPQHHRHLPTLPRAWRTLARAIPALGVRG